VIFTWKVIHKESGKVFTNVEEQCRIGSHGGDALYDLACFMYDKGFYIMYMDMEALAIAPRAGKPGKWDAFVIDECGHHEYLDEETWDVEIKFHELNDHLKVNLL